MLECWNASPDSRPPFFDIRKKLAVQLEAITEEYSYLKLDAHKEYYMLSTSTDPSSALSVSNDHDHLNPTFTDALASPNSGTVLIRP
jgi:hypothetical protein